ncbi:MAG: hypothetical protein ACJATF_004054 [Flavobacteriales bacterium]|jgi:hypothetical protein
MDYNVKSLLEKYWKGESTLEEEEELRDYFKQETIAAELEQYRSLFNYFGNQQSVSMNGGIKTQVAEEKLPERKTASMRSLFWKVAAAVVLLIGSYSVYNNVSTIQPKALVWEDTYETEEEALAKVKEVLLMVSRKMKKGTDKAAISLGKIDLAVVQEK